MNFEKKLNLNKKCPVCKKEGLLFIDNDKIFCQTQNCSFSVSFVCPICDTKIVKEAFGKDKNGDFFTCVKCKKKIHLKRVKYVIENGLMVDKEIRCALCNGPTIHKKAVNLANRCFFFPACSGQSDLFGNIKKEALTFLDLETTGLEAGKDAITEIGAVKIDEEGFEHIFQTFVQIPEELDKAITSLTGITNDMLYEAPDLKSCLEKLVEFVGDSVLVAHNAEFDVVWLLTGLLRHKLELKTQQVVCTLKWADRNSEPYKSLETLTKKYQIEHNNSHRALADAVVTKELFFIFENAAKAPRPIEPLKNYLGQAEKLVQKFADYVQI